MSMLISVVNHTERSDAEVLDVLRAIDRQIAEDFEPYWHISGSLRLEGRLGDDPPSEDQIQKGTGGLALNMRGHAILYLEDDYDRSVKWRGWHWTALKGIPYGFVYTKFSESRNVPWSRTFSHEVLELLADPEINRSVAGPHPTDDWTVWHCMEICDPVTAGYYHIDGVDVQDFVLPLYYTAKEEFKGRNNFLGVQKGEESLKSFGVNPGGYTTYYDGRTNELKTYTVDKKGEENRKAKEQTDGTQRRVSRRDLSKSEVSGQSAA